MGKDWLNDPWVWYTGILGADKKCVFRFLFFSSCLQSDNNTQRLQLSCPVLLYLSCNIESFLEKNLLSSRYGFHLIIIVPQWKSWFVPQNHFLYPCFLFLPDHALSSAPRTVNLILFFLLSLILSTPDNYLNLLSSCLKGWNSLKTSSLSTECLQQWSNQS